MRTSSTIVQIINEWLDSADIAEVSKRSYRAKLNLWFRWLNGIKCHPLYYNEDGKFCVERRLGCIGCPMQSDNGVADFAKYPKMLRQWIKASKVWWNKEREHPLASVDKFGDIYALMAHNLFFDDYDSFQAANTSMFGKEDWKQRLEDYFGIEL